MAEQARLDVLGPQRLAQQWVVGEVDLSDRQVVRRLPPTQKEIELRFAQRWIRRLNRWHQCSPLSSSARWARPRLIGRTKRSTPSLVPMCSACWASIAEDDRVLLDSVVSGALILALNLLGALSFPSTLSEGAAC